MVIKLALVALVATSAGVVIAVRRRRGKDEIDLWHEATTAPDLR